MKATKSDTNTTAVLKSLSGVGPAMEKRMNALGVNSVNDLKALTEERISSMTAEDAKISADQWNKWIGESILCKNKCYVEKPRFGGAFLFYELTLYTNDRTTYCRFYY